MANTKKNTGYLIAALVITAIIAYTMVSHANGEHHPGGARHDHAVPRVVLRRSGAVVHHTVTS